MGKGGGVELRKMLNQNGMIEDWWYDTTIFGTIGPFIKGSLLLDIKKSANYVVDDSQSTKWLINQSNLQA